MSMSYDIIVMGGGHTGCEAALASARRGFTTLLVTMKLDTIGLMSCNPAVGGLAKGHLVKEIDALGGEMAKNTDAAAIQFRTLNASKGFAVRATRAQADRKMYRQRMRSVLEGQPRLYLKEAEITDILVEGGYIKAVVADNGEIIPCRALVLAPGTFMAGLIHIGLESSPGGRIGDPPSGKISLALKRLGFSLGRLKTGTTPRLDGMSIDYGKTEEQPGDPNSRPFSFSSFSFDRPQASCHITYTNSHTHAIIREGLNRSPLFTGLIKGTGPRYCPSIEDKVVRFSSRERHQVFLEPEGLGTSEVYPNGLSTSLPYDIQRRFLRTIAGLEEVEIVRPGYAVEYDFVFPTQLKPSLETKLVKGLFFAGQINGTSGYEEAAAQGLIAGINVSLSLEGRAPLTLSRAVAYIGVLIDDLVTKGTQEPYRMFTSRAEYRLLLREDNADLRLRKRGYELGLVSYEDYQRCLEKEKGIKYELARLKKVRANGSAGRSYTLAQLLARPEIRYEHLAKLDEGSAEVPGDIAGLVEAEVKSQGYIQKQLKEVERFRRLESLTIPDDMDFQSLSGLSTEVKEKLVKVRPASLGQASRIPGITPAAISLLMIHIKKRAGQGLKHGH